VVARFTAFPARHPLAVLRAGLAGLALLGALAVLAPGRLGVGDFRVTDSESARAEAELIRGLGRDPEPGLLIVTQGEISPSSGVYRVAAETITSLALSQPEVAAVRQGPAFPDGQTTVLQVFFRDADAGAQEAAARDIARSIDPGPLRVSIGGRTAERLEAKDELEGELGTLAALVLVPVLLMLTRARGARLALAALMIAAGTTLATLVSARLLGAPLRLSLLGLAPAAALALALATEYSLSIAARFHRRRPHAETADDAAIAATRESAAPLLLASTAAAATMACAAILPLEVLRSAAVAGVLSAALSAVLALLVVPAVLARQAEDEGEGSASTDDAPQDGEDRSVWRRMASAVSASRAVAVPVCLLSLVALLALAVPVRTLRVVGFGPTELPKGAEARTAGQTITDVLGPGATTPARVPIPTDAGDELQRYRDRLGRVSGIVQVAGGAAPTSGRAWELTAQLATAPSVPVGQGVVEAMRNVEAGFNPAVGGPDARLLDARRRPPGLAGVTIGAIALVALVLCLALGRSISIAAGSTLAAILPAAAGLGVAAAVFQGPLGELLGHAGNGLHLGALALAVSAAAAISISRSLLFAARVGEAGRSGSGETSARALDGQALAAGAILAIASAALVGASLDPAKEFGLALAVATVADLILARALFLSALARLAK
jgi:putative drug exporter of the RND superfamily